MAAASSCTRWKAGLDPPNRVGGSVRPGLSDSICRLDHAHAQGGVQVDLQPLPFITEGSRDCLQGLDFGAHEFHVNADRRLRIELSLPLVELLGQRRGFAAPKLPIDFGQIGLSLGRFVFG
jgi:hypothetical protein